MTDLKKELEGMIDEENIFDKSENEFSTRKRIEIPHAIKLKEKITYGDLEREEIVFKNRFKASMMYHLRVINDDHQYGHYMPIISQMTGEPESLIGELGSEDFIECVSVMTRFFSTGGF